jgi:hypothetical protein
MTASSATAAQARPSIVGDGVEKTVRSTRYGDVLVAPLLQKNHMLADEGSYFVTTNPTPATAIAFAVSAAVSETAGYYLFIRNGWSIGASDAKNLYLDYLRLITSVAPASGTAGHFFFKADLASKYTSGGSTLVPVNPNLNSGAASGAIVYAGALTTAAASSSAKLLARGIFRGAIPVVNDETVFHFGSSEPAGAIITGGTSVQRMSIPVPPIVIAPGYGVGLQLWFPSNASTAAQFELELGHWER